MRRKRGDQMKFDFAQKKRGQPSDGGKDYQDSNVVTIREIRIRNHTQRVVEKLRQDGILADHRDD